MTDLSVTEQAIIDLQRERDAMARRAAQFKQTDPTVEQITDYDRRRFGQAVRFEIDVCIPVDDLKHELNMIRAEITNCIAILERKGTGNERRKMVHSRLSDVRGELRFLRQERELQENRLIK